MRVITKLSELDSLSFAAEIKAQLKQAIYSNFETSDETEQFWSENDCFLMLVAPGESLEELYESEPEHGRCLDFIISYPEEVLLLKSESGEIYLLALAIMNDAGGGGYLLTPLSHLPSWQANLLGQLNP